MNKIQESSQCETITQWASKEVENFHLPEWRN